MILGVIPARGGSKGIPRKNVKPLLGVPLVAWTIKSAQSATSLDRFVVSTEDPEIAAVAAKYGAEVLERPPELAGDEALSREVVAHALRTLGGDAAVLLQPTSPLRRPGRIDMTVNDFLKGGWDSMATGFLQLQYPPHGVEHRRQDIVSVFVNDGSVIVSDRAVIESGSLFGTRAGTLVTSREENVDIDDEFDFDVAEHIAAKAVKEGWLSLPVPRR
ncbi:MAG: acylneuraminate cytidylyltransferase family protein [Deltaproteobacteria bacterium]|jgi:CMP-N-acetylneuraminic acid synthetase|nr:acylneuraminate cytidylyltransferase family protein [Deltaproteobacteria bacterium]